MMTTLLLLALVSSVSFLLGYDYSRIKWESKIDLFRGEKVKAEHVADLLRKELNSVVSRLKEITDLNKAA